MVFKPQGTFVRQCGYKGGKTGQLNKPSGVTVAGNEVLVAVTDNHRIQVLRLNDGVFVR